MTKQLAYGTSTPDSYVKPTALGMREPELSDTFLRGLVSNNRLGKPACIRFSVRSEASFSGLGYGTIYSNIEMGLSGEGNISEDPGFVDPDNGDYHLRPDSPCIDKGTNESAPSTDWEGDPRPLNGDLDGTAVTNMGADEFHFEANLPIILKNYSP